MIKPVAIEWVCMDGSFTHRAKVFGGWLVRYDTWSNVDNYSGQNRDTHTTTTTVTSCMEFVSDPEHVWDKAFTLDKLITGE